MICKLFSSNFLGGNLHGGGGHDKGHPNFNLGVGGNFSKNIKIGTPLIKMFRLPGKKIMCMDCFATKHPIHFRSVALSVDGLGGIVNSQLILYANPVGRA